MNSSALLAACGAVFVLACSGSDGGGPIDPRDGGDRDASTQKDGGNPSDAASGADADSGSDSGSNDGGAGDGGTPVCTPGDDLENAPPVTTVDGLRAVPIDIESVDAKVVLDAAIRTTSIEVTMKFKMGPSDGYPIFDLRQTIDRATLNGVDVAPAKLAQHDFGGGTGAELRIVETTLPACSVNTLKLDYIVQQPTSASAKAIFWDGETTRVSWDFWMSDLYAGRYLEMWFPTNLIYDKFKLDLDIELQHSRFAHSVITNGTVDLLSATHWRISYPKGFTALSHMLMLVPDETITKHAANLVLTGGKTIALELVKENLVTVDLPGLAEEIKSDVEEFTLSTGTYPHGDRLTVYVWNNPSRSMEYDGATTSNLRSLKHELFHSWYARGVKPARQTDGWIDEAWTVYNTDPVNAFKVVPLDPNAAPVLLSPDNPWFRLTPGASYAAGSKLFAGLASEIGLDPLRNAMKTYFAQNALNVVTTENLEKHLYCTSTDADVTAAFHRFVYGQSDTAPAPNPAACSQTDGGLRARAAELYVHSRSSSAPAAARGLGEPAPNLDIEPLPVTPW